MDAPEVIKVVDGDPDIAPGVRMIGVPFFSAIHSLFRLLKNRSSGAFASSLRADETPISMLAPGKGKTQVLISELIARANGESLCLPIIRRKNAHFPSITSKGRDRFPMTGLNIAALQ